MEEKFTSLFFFPDELKEHPCSLNGKRKKISLSMGTSSALGWQGMPQWQVVPNTALQRPQVGTWHLLAISCIQKKWFNFLPVSDVYKWPTPPTAHARNVWVPTFLVPHSNWGIFFPELTWNESGFSTDVCENAKWEMKIRCFERPRGKRFAEGCSLFWQPWPWNL